MNCLDLEIAIMSYFGVRQNLIVPNVTDSSFLVPFETDILVLNKTGYAHGFEIKVSKSDLLADFKKKQHKNINKMFNGRTGMERYFGRFKHFSYAVPEDLVDVALESIPEFCGLYVCKEYSLRRVLSEVRKPKKVSSYKWSEKERLQLARLGTMRILGLKIKIRDNERNHKIKMQS